VRSNATPANLSSRCCMKLHESHVCTVYVCVRRDAGLLLQSASMAFNRRCGRNSIGRVSAFQAVLRRLERAYLPGKTTHFHNRLNPSCRKLHERQRYHARGPPKLKAKSGAQGRAQKNPPLLTGHTFTEVVTPFYGGDPLDARTV